MAQTTRKRNISRTESLTIRLDPKTRFALEFVSRITKQTITTVVESAIRDIAEKTYSDISKTYTDNYKEVNDTNWKYYWDVNEGVRFINLAKDPNTNPTYDEEEILEFIKIHWKYFSEDEVLYRLRRDCIDVIWPHINKLIKIWRETKSNNRQEASDYMQQLLDKANISIDKKS